MSELDLVKVKKGIDDYFKLKYFALYTTFTAVIFYVVGKTDIAVVLLVVSMLQLVLMSRYREEYLDGKEKNL